MEKAYKQKLYMSLLLVVLPSFVSSVHFRIDCVFVPCVVVLSVMDWREQTVAVQGRSLTSNTGNRGRDFSVYHAVDLFRKATHFSSKRPFFSFKMNKADQEEGSHFETESFCCTQRVNYSVFTQNPLPKSISGHGNDCPFHCSRHLFYSSCRRTHISPFHMH